MLLGRSLLAVIASVVFAEPAFAAALGGAASPGIPWLRIVFAFAFCVGVTFAAIWLLRLSRAGRMARSAAGWFPTRGAGAERQIEVVETRRISAHADVCLLHWQDRSYLILVGPSGVTLIDSDHGDRPEQGG